MKFVLISGSGNLILDHGQLDHFGKKLTIQSSVIDTGQRLYQGSAIDELKIRLNLNPEFAVYGFMRLLSARTKTADFVVYSVGLKF